MHDPMKGDGAPGVEPEPRPCGEETLVVAAEIGTVARRSSADPLLDGLLGDAGDGCDRLQAAQGFTPARPGRRVP